MPFKGSQKENRPKVRFYGYAHGVYIHRMERARPAKTALIILHVIVGLLIITGMVAVSMRIEKLISAYLSGFTPPEGSYDANFARFPIITFVHILCGAVFLVLAPFQFSRSFREKHFRLHRLFGRIYIVCGLVAGGTALWMALKFAFGGWTEISATLVFGTFLIFALLKAFYHIRQREVSQHRAWMTRAFATGLAVATIRPMVGIVFAITGLDLASILGIAFWLSFIIHLAVAEWWLWHLRGRWVLSP